VSSSDPPLTAGGECTGTECIPSEITVSGRHLAHHIVQAYLEIAISESNDHAEADHGRFDNGPVPRQLNSD